MTLVETSSSDATIEMLVSKMSQPPLVDPDKRASLDRQGLRRHKAPWTTNEDRLVRKLHADGATLVQIARWLQRTPRAVQYRFQHLTPEACVCGKTLPAPLGRGRKRLFCSDRCRLLNRRVNVKAHRVLIQAAA